MFISSRYMERPHTAACNRPLRVSALNDSRALTGRSESLANDAGAKRMRSGPLGVARNERERCLEQAAVCGRSQMKCD